MSVFKPEKDPCQVCGKERALNHMPFLTEPDLAICADCLDKIWNKAGCSHWEEGCCDCPLWIDGYGDGSCRRKPFPLKLIGYDPSKVYTKAEQPNLL